MKNTTLQIGPICPTPPQSTKRFITLIIILIGLTETWFKPDEFTMVNEASPPGYTSDHIPRASFKCGGVAAHIHEKLLRFRLLSFSS